jgi:hypothetical protein
MEEVRECDALAAGGDEGRREVISVLSMLIYVHCLSHWFNT